MAGGGSGRASWRHVELLDVTSHGVAKALAPSLADDAAKPPRRRDVKSSCGMIKRDSEAAWLPHHGESHPDPIAKMTSKPDPVGQARCFREQSFAPPELHSHRDRRLGTIRARPGDAPSPPRQPPRAHGGALLKHCHVVVERWRHYLAHRGKTRRLPPGASKNLNRPVPLARDQNPLPAQAPTSAPTPR